MTSQHLTLECKNIAIVFPGKPSVNMNLCWPQWKLYAIFHFIFSSWRKYWNIPINNLESDLYFIQCISSRMGQKSQLLTTTKRLLRRHVVYTLTNFTQHIIFTFCVQRVCSKASKQKRTLQTQSAVWSSSETTRSSELARIWLAEEKHPALTFALGAKHQLPLRICNAKRNAERISEWNWVTLSHCLVSRVSSMSGTAADLPVISDIEAVTAVNRALGPGRRSALQRR